MPSNKKNIRNLNLTDLKDFFISKKKKPFRGKQVYEWLWKKSVRSFSEMTNLDKETQVILNDNFCINHLEISQQQQSKDKTIKFAFKLIDNKTVEGVLIPTKSRMTACISSQVGCSLSCKFCATGQLNRLRNLDAGEIYDQVFLINQVANEIYKKNITNIVYMGMGEPLLNYNNVVDSIHKITSIDGLGMSPKRITISTAGISKMIKKLADENIRCNLALSLHAANDEKRNYIMAINQSNSLDSLSEAMEYFYAKTQIRPTYEYIIFKNFNDEIQDAEELTQFARLTPCKINIIEYNPIDNGEFQQAEIKKVNHFVDYLERKKLIINIRKSRGKDIDAACGQLANKINN